MGKYDFTRMMVSIVIMTFTMILAAVSSEGQAISMGIIGAVYFLNMITIELFSINAKIKNS